MKPAKQRGGWVVWGWLSVVAMLAVADAQTHKVAKTEEVVRAVGVYEWTGDLAKPTASRLIPVSLFINGRLEDAAIYLARPVPFALLTGNVYELDEAGLARGTLDLDYARHLQATEAATTTYDDGWFGYGTFVAPPPAKRAAALRPARTLGIVTSAKNEDPDKPHFSSKSPAPGSGGSAQGTGSASETPAADPDRPTMRRHADSPGQNNPADPSTNAGGTSASTTTSGDAPAPDPDRPTMRRRTSDSDQTASSGTGGAGGGSGAGDTPADDPDRPTLRRRTPENAKKTSAKSDQASVTGGGSSLNDDPNRPTLHHGKPTGIPKEDDFPKLAGLPSDLHQMIAVSDAATRSSHDFSRTWDDDAQHQEVLAKMQAAARAQLTAYAGPTSAPALAAGASHKPASRPRRGGSQETPPPPPEPLLDEQLKGYTLSYGGAPTYVYSAHTAGEGAALRYLILVAQVDMQGTPQIAMKNVTDAAHLDRTPRMRLVDAVDAEASNRASLLFELRGQSSRQFALYRVIGAHAEATFSTGTTQ